MSFLVMLGRYGDDGLNDLTQTLAGGLTQGFLCDAAPTTVQSAGAAGATTLWFCNGISDMH